MKKIFLLLVGSVFLIADSHGMEVQKAWNPQKEIVTTGEEISFLDAFMSGDLVATEDQEMVFKDHEDSTKSYKKRLSACSDFLETIVVVINLAPRGVRNEHPVKMSSKEKILHNHTEELRRRLHAEPSTERAAIHKLCIAFGERDCEKINSSCKELHSIQVKRCILF